MSGKLRGYGGCGRCGDTWDWKESHTTWFDEIEGVGEGCSPLCEACWDKLPPEQRLPYYEQLVDRWVADFNNTRIALYQEIIRSEEYDYERKRRLIREAVLEGG